MAAVREAVGGRMAIMVDANQAGTYLNPQGAEVWTYDRALVTAQEMEQLGVAWWGSRRRVTITSTWPSFVTG
jgi:L-alanine-DL-glutamate epimerase-like enolase superfamily enzyme